MADPFATAADLAVVYPIASGDEAQASTWLGYASAVIRKSFPDIDTRIANDQLDPDLAKLVCIEMVKRILANPDGAMTVSQTSGPFAITKGFGSLSVGDLALTQAEIDLLSPPTTTVGVGSFQVKAGLGYGREGLRSHVSRELPRRHAWREDDCYFDAFCD